MNLYFNALLWTILSILAVIDLIIIGIYCGTHKSKKIKTIFYIFLFLLWFSWMYSMVLRLVKTTELFY